MVFFWLFFCGVGASTILFSESFEFFNVLPWFPTKKQQTIDAFSILDQNQIKKVTLLFQPWLGVHVTEEVNIEIQKLLDELVEKYIQNWYSKLTDDTELIMEIKISLKHSIALLCNRLSKIDLSSFLFEVVVPNVADHINICLKAKEQGYKSEKEIMTYYSKVRLHYCLKSRRNELNYIRSLVGFLVPIICSKSILQSKLFTTAIKEIFSANVILNGIDAIDNPDWINHMFLLYFDDEVPEKAFEPPSKEVNLLHNYSCTIIMKSSLLHYELKKVLHDTDMMYQFMNFLKRNKLVHYLQFFSTVEDFHQRCLSIEENNSLTEKLHKEVVVIYETYCVPKNKSFISFSLSVRDELKKIAYGPRQNITRIKTSTPLCKAFDEVYNTLENIHFPLFQQDDTYYQMVCGDRAPDSAKKVVNTDPLLKSFKKKLFKKYGKQLLKADGDEKRPENLEKNFLENEEELLISKTINSDYLHNLYSGIKSLSMLRLNISEVQKVSYVKNDTFVYNIHIVDLQSDDLSDISTKWQINRNYSEFYSLEGKLTDFHGSLNPISLPPRKFLLTKNYEFLESKRMEFEKFLQDLITSSSLQKSELLYQFLVPPKEGITQNLGPISISLSTSRKVGNFIKRVPTKLMKEKGRHIENFMISFAQSCEADKSSPVTKTSSTKSAETIMNQKLHSELYSYDELPWIKTKAKLMKNEVLPTKLYGLFDCISIMCARLFKANKSVLKVFAILRIVFKKTIENYAYNLIKDKIKMYKQEHFMCKLISNFRRVLFHSHDQPRTMKQKFERKSKALQAFKNSFPGILSWVIYKEKFDSGCEEIFECLQHPKLNKQLGYMVFDNFLREIFPETITCSSKPDNK